MGEGMAVATGVVLDVVPAVTETEADAEPVVEDPEEAVGDDCCGIASTTPRRERLRRRREGDILLRRDVLVERALCCWVLTYIYSFRCCK